MYNRVYIAQYASQGITVVYIARYASLLPGYMVCIAQYTSLLPGYMYTTWVYPLPTHPGYTLPYPGMLVYYAAPSGGGVTRPWAQPGRKRWV